MEEDIKAQNDKVGFAPGSDKAGTRLQVSLTPQLAFPLWSINE